ncbi:hypothetical protein Q3G72_007749 [Acer saccharum]|nr:hypothetical protein Q3G72_007749 [Acer saccharum]
MLKGSFNIKPTVLVSLILTVEPVKVTQTGKTHEINPNFSSDTFHRQQRHNLRSFPEGTRNCYTLKPNQGGNKKYLIRAIFEYGNYDSKNQIPEFDLYLGVNRWTTVSLEISMFEIIHIPSAAYIDVCLNNTGKGVPYISALELRPLDNSLYRIPNGALLNIYSFDLGGNNDIRYPEDVFDRYWFPYNDSDWLVMSTKSTIQSSADGSNYKVPDKLLQTAAASKSASVPLSLFIKRNPDPDSVCYIYFHFAEIEILDNGSNRELKIEVNGVRNLSSEPATLEYLMPMTKTSTGLPMSADKEISFKIYAAEGSDLPPILNAVEVFLYIELPVSPTNFNDVDAIRKIKSVYGLKRDSWQGDPCLPSDYMWDGLNCSNDGSSPPSIISLDLSSSGLKGDIAPYFADFTMIQSLDLSSNDLTGRVPDFLSQLTSLTVLNLGKNKLSGLVPAVLIERSKNGALKLSVEGNPDICSLADSCDQKKKNNIVVPLVASIAAFSTAIIAIFAIFCWLKKRKKQAVIVLGKSESKSENKNDTFAAKKQQFTYSDIVKITKNFEKVLGEGGFGTVYLGYLDDTEVAVKLLSSSSAQGYKEFHSEVKLLMRVHHRNLTSLVGYCIEGKLMGIIYEYMTNGSLEQYFSVAGKHKGKNAVSILSWDDRMRIAVDAAQGLEYLHEGCKPPIIHRDELLAPLGTLILSIIHQTG